jgi:hypothetical protein
MRKGFEDRERSRVEAKRGDPKSKSKDEAQRGEEYPRPTRVVLLVHCNKSHSMQLLTTLIVFAALCNDIPG